MAESRVGIWLIGAKGGVAATAIVGLISLQKKLTDGCALVSQLPQFDGLDFADWTDFVVGGHEIRKSPLVEEARLLVDQSRTIARELYEACKSELERIDRRIRPGVLINVGSAIEALCDADIPRNESPQAAVGRLRHDLAEFIQTENLAHVVVVNVASTEPPADIANLPQTWAELMRLLDSSQASPLPASSLYAIAALESGCSYVNFTPSLGAAPRAIDELARLCGSRYFGCDGKTGETLLKSVLAPMFARRNLRVLSWVAHNIFGNMDAIVLNDPVNKQAKVASKDRLLGEILGYRPRSHISIEYIEDLGDWKTAWDHIHFRGFLGVPMTLQLIWQGCDSVLAAPLVLDLVRFTELAWRRSHVGRMDFLASFFKNPHGATEHCFDRQFQMLQDWALGKRMKDEG
jgi:myo-inositol-1-phosphate synthase